MHKPQNVLARIAEVIARCRRHGILVMSGLLLSPASDTLDYIASIPRSLRECGLYVPAYVCFETPFPGTPHFQRLAASSPPAFLPNALLRDFNGYTLVTRPRHASPEDFVAAYRELHRSVYSRGTRLAKLGADLVGVTRRGGAVPVLFDLYELASVSAEPTPGRTFITGSDKAPPETVPLTDADFRDEVERDAILEPWRVSDAEGRALPSWRHGAPIYGPGGVVVLPADFVG
jgi:hypothetical protein